MDAVDTEINLTTRTSHVCGTIVPIGIRLSLACLGLTLIGIPANIRAASVVIPNFQQLVDNATEILVSEVAARRSQWIDTTDGRAIVTLVTFSVIETLKGSPRTQTSLEFMGGTIGDVTMNVSDMPQFNVGDRDILFVGNRNAVSPLVGFMYGRFRIVRDDRQGIDSVLMYDGHPFGATAFIGDRAKMTQRSNTAMPLRAFRAEILSRVRSQDRAR
jgi:hypothetical protein